MNIRTVRLRADAISKRTRFGMAMSASALACYAVVALLGLAAPADAVAAPVGLGSAGF
jgi:hypothetical protein